MIAERRERTGTTGTTSMRAKDTTMKHLKFMMAIALAILVSSGDLLAQTSTQKPNTQKPNSTTKPLPPPLPVASPDYLIGPADILRIDVVDEASYSGDFVVRPDGKISMLQIDEIPVVGLTTEALKKKIKTELGRFFNDPVPEVFVQVKQINSRIVYINGAVRKPGPYPLSGPMTVLQLITIAGGLDEFAQRKKILVISGTQHNAKGESITWIVNYEDIERGRNLSKNNIILNPGDTVVVPGGQP
jgi:polysaccharide export outer membrane protein